jgi:uncharacterized PurR-regulated membrane protein YhhQ (DUF165 family)
MALVLRDLVQRSLGLWWALAAIIAGTIISFSVAPKGLVVASGVAFLISEVVDLLIYTPLQRRGLVFAAVASSVAGAVIDSVTFLLMAFGDLQFLLGQVVGKCLAIAVAIPLLICLRNRYELSIKPVGNPKLRIRT